jgi:hypothetical protein
MRGRCAGAVVNPSVHFVLPSSKTSTLHQTRYTESNGSSRSYCSLLVVPNEHMAGSLLRWPVVPLSRPRGAYIASIVHRCGLTPDVDARSLEIALWMFHAAVVA